METTCVSLIKELQKIWDEVGEPEKNRDKMLLELEQECLDAYRRKVDQANRFRAQLRQAIADSQAELASICASLGDRSLPIIQIEPGSLIKELADIFPQVEMMQKKKNERKVLFTEILDQIQNLSKELFTSTKDKSCLPILDESDLSLTRLEELKIELHALEKEKSDRLKQVLDHLTTIHSICGVLGMDFKIKINGIHPTLENPGSKKSITDDTMEKLSNAVCRLNEDKSKRLKKVQDLATTMVGLWNLMDISNDEQKRFQNVIRYIGASENEVTEPNALSLESIKFIESEIFKLQKMKASMIMEVLLKRKTDLEQICKEAHMTVVMHEAIDFSTETLESGVVDPLYLLEQIDLQMSKVKEEASARKEILEKIDKWLAACEEETWLEEYNRDHNRYNSGRGTHLLLKRAEKARALVHKIPAMVETLREKAKSWDQKRGVAFSYDGVSLLSMLDDYDIQKHKKEQERQKQREQKKLQGQLIVEQEARFGSKPSPIKSGKKLIKAASMMSSSSTDRRYSVVGSMLKTPKLNRTFSSSSSSSSNAHNLHYSHHSGGHAKIHPGKSNLRSISNVKAPTNQQETQTTPPPRKPLSPVFSSLSTNNIKTPTNTMTLPTTPSSTSSLMKIGMTSTTPDSTPFAPHHVEYSFEEMRAGRFPLKT
ncbi:65-kDa microtubule-associated protein 3 [Lactuca sativa]|uniref:65-kDa microtubule-associated protein 3 n=1 Tax=Lactuca sativa TaxID=4236 RepID=UPI000CD8DD91|nr:65-kDa microtubule-associated protein 3 [Lactuca sativa]XP_042756369.1 65-kDa microtubule-associated protein 3 [Lactuca sativa]XP_052625552.1 65-kDa microtubule-associated protein 3 [Lactuca sativa]XP_052625553.1 65-kDa microtubule-associated protein 3 [Lactuca sativa]